MVMKNIHNPESQHQDHVDPDNKGKRVHDKPGELKSGAVNNPYWKFFELAPRGYLMLDAHGKIINANLYGAQLLGVNRDRLSQKDFTDFVKADYRELFQSKLRDAVVGSGSQGFELFVQRPGGRAQKVSVFMSSQFTTDAQAVVYMTLDDTPRRRSIDKSGPWDHHKHIKDLITFASGPIFVCNTSLQITMVNPAFERLTGYTMVELIGRSVDQIFTLDQAGIFNGENDSDESGEKPLSLIDEITMHHVHGMTRFIAWSSIPTYIDDDEKVDAILTYGQDITELIQLEQSAHTPCHVYESLGKLIVDPDKRVVRVNRTLCQMIGCDEKVMLGHPIQTYLDEGSKGSSSLASIWDIAARDHYWQGELRGLRENKAGFPVFVTISPTFDNHGQVSNYVVSFIDIKKQNAAGSIIRSRYSQRGRKMLKTAAEVGQWKEEIDEVNSALKAMIRLREVESLEAKRNLMLELEQEVIPFLAKLRKMCGAPKQLRLLGALEANVQRLVSSHGSLAGGVSVYRNLTPKEIQVASMVREGFSTKAIAATLSISPETVSIHRKNIRKKLGLEAKSDNLRSYLVSLVSTE